MKGKSGNLIYSTLQKDIATVTVFKDTIRGSKCKEKCGSCKRYWSRTGTDNVSQAKDTGGKKNFLCDMCMLKLENEELKYRDFMNDQLLNQYKSFIESKKLTDEFETFQSDLAFDKGN